MRSTIVQTQVNFCYRKDRREQTGQMEGNAVIQVSGIADSLTVAS